VTTGYICGVAQYNLVGEYTSHIAHIGREGKIKILNSKIEFFFES
jgi:hypothetical protein